MPHAVMYFAQAPKDALRPHKQKGLIWLDNVKDFVYTPGSELHFHCAKRVWEFQTAPELPNAAPVDLRELHELCLLSRTAYGC